MMTNLKFNLISIPIRRCFIFVLVLNVTTPSTATPNTTEPKTTTPRPDCNAVLSTPFISDIQFGAFLLVCVFALMCVVYLLYLKKLEVESKKCSCQMQKMCKLGNPSDEPRYSLDPLTISKFLAHHNVTAVQRNEPSSDQAISSTGAAPSTHNANLEKEIHTWNAHKYLEYLKNEDEHVYENPTLVVPQRKHLNNNPASASNAQVSHNQRLPSLNINENVKISPKIYHKGVLNDTDRF